MIVVTYFDMNGPLPTFEGPAMLQCSFPEAAVKKMSPFVEF